MENLFRDRRLIELYEYWRSKRGDGAVPRRADIDLSEITHLLPILNIVEVSRDPPRFRHRLIGTEVVEAMGRDATGEYVNRDLYGDAVEEIAAALETVVREARPYRRLAHLSWYERDWMEMEAIELPLADDEGQIVALLCGANFRRREPGPGPRMTHEPLPAPNGVK